MAIRKVRPFGTPSASKSLLILAFIGVIVGFASANATTEAFDFQSRTAGIEVEQVEKPVAVKPANKS